MDNSFQNLGCEGIKDMGVVVKSEIELGQVSSKMERTDCA